MNKKCQESSVKYQGNSNLKIFKFDHPLKIPHGSGAGFTLVEIMVTITIMIVVFGFVITSISAIGRKARDQQRITDLQNIQAALSQYYGDQHFYPDSGLDLSSSTQLNNDIGNPQISSATKIYLNTLPKDPQGATNYCYKPLTSFSGGTNCNNDQTVPGATPCQYYRLCVQMEAAPANPSSNCTTVCGGSYNHAIELNPNQSGGH